VISEVIPGISRIEELNDSEKLVSRKVKRRYFVDNLNSFIIIVSKIHVIQ
ncbi:unnamed protein product, partial [marine sediment metagenome]